MRILVIEDNPEHIESAIQTLRDKDLTIIDNVAEACDKMKNLSWVREFDAVLTDLMLPIGDYRGTLHFDIKDRTEQIPAGLVFAIRAKNAGVEHVGICTDSTRHNSVICAMLEIIGTVWDSPQTSGITHSELRQCGTRNNTKDWLGVLERCVSAASRS